MIYATQKAFHVKGRQKNEKFDRKPKREEVQKEGSSVNKNNMIKVSCYDLNVPPK